MPCDSNEIIKIGLICRSLSWNYQYSSLREKYTHPTHFIEANVDHIYKTLNMYVCRLVRSRLTKKKICRTLKIEIYCILLNLKVKLKKIANAGASGLK